LNKERRKAGKDRSEAFLISCIPHQELFIPWFKIRNAGRQEKIGAKHSYLSLRM
jgi:hypothetical protein